jgi:hypothetical protein
MYLSIELLVILRDWQHVEQAFMVFFLSLGVYSVAVHCAESSLEFASVSVEKF